MPSTWPFPKTSRQQRSPAGHQPPRPQRPPAGRTLCPQIDRAATVLTCKEAENPIVLAGHGASRAGASAGPRPASPEKLGTSGGHDLPRQRVCSPTTILSCPGAVGFMRHDYVNFGFDEADVIVTVGYELQEFDPVRINPMGDKQIIHILAAFPAEVDATTTSPSACRAVSPGGLSRLLASAV